MNENQLFNSTNINCFYYLFLRQFVAKNNKTTSDYRRRPTMPYGSGRRRGPWGRI